MPGKFTNNNSGGFDPDSLSGPDGHEAEGDAFTSESEFLSERWSPGSVGTMHRFSDLDSSTFAQHHTLGPRHNQSSPGDHNHDGSTSKSLLGWQSFTPVWDLSGATTHPSFGNAIINSAWAQINKLVIWRANITFGTTTNFGAGTGWWSFSTPLSSVSQTGNGGGFYGKAYASHSGTQLLGACSIEVFSGQSLLGLAINAVSAWNQSTLAWASNDYIAWEIIYQVP